MTTTQGLFQVAKLTVLFMNATWRFVWRFLVSSFLAGARMTRTKMCVVNETCPGHLAPREIFRPAQCKFLGGVEHCLLQNYVTFF